MSVLKLGKAFIESAAKHILREAPELDEVAKRITPMLEKRNGIARSRGISMQDELLDVRPQLSSRAYEGGKGAKVELNGSNNDMNMSVFGDGFGGGLDVLFKRYGIKPELGRDSFQFESGLNKISATVAPEHLHAARRVVDYMASSPITNPKAFLQGLDDLVLHTTGIRPERVFTAASNTLEKAVTTVAPNLAARVWGHSAP